MAPSVEDLKRLREVLRDLDTDLRSKSRCGICGRPTAGFVPAGQSAEQAGLCRGRHALTDPWNARAFAQRRAAIVTTVRAAPAQDLRRVHLEQLLMRLARLERAATKAGARDVEGKSMTAWCALLAAEEALASAGWA